MQLCSVGSTHMISVQLHCVFGFPFLGGVRLVISLTCAWPWREVSSPSPLLPWPPRLQKHHLWGLPGLALTPTRWDIPGNLSSTFPKHGNIIQPSREQWGGRRQHQWAQSNMFRRNKIKQQSSLEQERLLKGVLPGNVSSCFLTTLTRACHRAKQATPPASGERTELQ